MGNIKSNNKSFVIFQFLGFLCGGIIPIFIALVKAQFSEGKAIMLQEFIPAFFIYAFFVTIIGVCTLILDIYYSQGKFKKFLFPAQAFLSFVLIHLLVIYSGGPKNSIFAMSYLYLPAIVGYTYGSGTNLVGASSILGISYIVNLYYFEEQYYFFSWIVNFSNSPVPQMQIHEGSNSVYLIVFLIQIIVTTIIASKRSMVDNEEDVIKP